MVNQAGACAWVACATILASGVNFRFDASSLSIMIWAQAPSEIALAFAAVTVPFSLNAGFRVVIFSGLAFPGNSSSIIVSCSIL